MDGLESVLLSRMLIWPGMGDVKSRSLDLVLVVCISKCHKLVTLETA